MLNRQTDAIIERTTRHPWLEVLARNELLQLRTGRVDFVCEDMNRNKITCVELVSGSQCRRMRDRLLRSVNYFKSMKLFSRNDENREARRKKLINSSTYQLINSPKTFFSPLTSHFSLNNAFTIAEVIIVLGIVGIIAQVTLPALIQNVQDAQYKTGKDEVRMSIAEAGKILSVTDEIASATSAEDFVKNYLSKQLKIARYCAPADMEQCGMPSGNPTTFKNLYNANVASMPKTWTLITNPYGVTGDAPADGDASLATTNPTTQNFNNSYVFLAANGIAVNLFYNPYCAYNFQDKVYHNSPSYSVTDMRPQFSMDTACMSGVYDMNGLKKPNQVGRDIGFFGVFYNGVQSTSVATLPYTEGIDTESYDWSMADNYCRGIKGQKLPTVDELSALYLGRNITGMPAGGVWLWSASAIPGLSGHARDVGFATGRRSWSSRSGQRLVRCVRD